MRTCGRLRGGGHRRPRWREWRRRREDLQDGINEALGVKEMDLDKRSMKVSARVSTLIGSALVYGYHEDGPVLLMLTA